ncbi:hypothetical protein [Methanosarcina mazei]|nr:hypothetical protein [Methanosarcina mazei]
MGVVIELVTDISSRDLTITPVQLLPMILLYFSLIYKLSKNYVLASIIIFIYLLTDTTGTPEMFFWPHGIGKILFYAILLILLNIYSKTNKNPSFNLLLVIFGLSLAFTSYDLYGMLLILLLILFLLSMFLNRSFFSLNKKTIPQYLQKSPNILNYCILLIVIELGLSKFIYNTLIPIFRTTKYVEISAVDKLFLAYFSAGQTENPLADMVLSYPSIITGLNITKYAILTISIIICVIFIIRKIVKSEKSENVNIYDLFTISFFLSSVIFGILRLHIGQIPITLLYTPGIFCTIWLYRFTKKFKNWAIFVIILLFITTCVSQYVHNNHDFVARDQNMFEYVRMPAYWYLEHGEPVVVSDVLTRNVFLLSFSEYFEIYQKSTDNNRLSFKEVRLMSSDDAKFLVQKSNITQTNKYYIINYKLGSVSLGNWMFFKSWKYSKDKIDSNLKIKKIYDMSDIAIYY